MIEWHQKIGRAESIRSLVDITTEFLSSLTTSDWATVPDSCRPLGIQGIHGLRFWHDRLVDEFCRAAAQMRHSRVHQDLVGFFIAALERAEEIDPAAANDAAEQAGQRRNTRP